MSLLAAFLSWFDALFVDQNSLEAYLAGASSLAELESRQLQWERSANSRGLAA